MFRACGLKVGGHGRRRARLRTVLLIVASLLAAIPALSRGAFSDKVTTTPAIVQHRQGPGGDLLPFGGEAFCVPTAVAMSLAYLRQNGFVQLGGDASPEAENLNLVKVLAGLMGTSELYGTTYDPNMANALAVYLAAKGIAPANFSAAYTVAPSIGTLAALNQPGSVVSLCNGYYNGSGVRQGGHCVTLLGTGLNALGQIAPNVIAINNPYPSTYAPVADVPGSALEYLNAIVTTGNLVSKGAIMLDPAQYPGYRSNTTVIERVLTLTINPSQLSANNPTITTWTLPALGQSINLRDGNLGVLAPIAGAGGFTLLSGNLTLTAPNNSTGPNTITAGRLSSTIAAGVPFGTGAISVDSGVVALTPAASASALAFTAASGADRAFTYSHGATLALSANGHSSVTLTIGGKALGAGPNLIRTGVGTLVLAPASGTAGLGTTERILVAGTGANLPLLTNGIVASSIVVQDNDVAKSGDFATYGMDGFARASYLRASDTSITAAGADAVFEADVNQVVLGSSGTVVVYALKVEF